jgi:hypothetical protein
MSKRVITTVECSNINHDRRITGFKPFSGFKLENRLSSMEFTADITCLCEIGCDILEEVVKKFPEHQVFTGLYAPYNNPQSFNFLIAVKNNIPVLMNKMFWFTSTPNEILIKREECPVLQECKESYEKGSLIVVVEVNEEPIIISMNHFGLRLPYRLKSAELLNEEIERLKKEFNTNKSIIGGDFNTFTDNGPAEIQLGALLKTGELAKTNAPFTFVAYPFDTGLDGKELMEKYHKMTGTDQDIRVQHYKNICEKYNGPIISYLDHIITSGISAKVEVLGQFENVEELVKQSCITGIPAFLSDHFSTKVTF